MVLGNVLHSVVKSRGVWSCLGKVYRSVVKRWYSHPYHCTVWVMYPYATTWFCYGNAVSCTLMIAMLYYTKLRNVLTVVSMEYKLKEDM